MSVFGTLSMTKLPHKPAIQQNQKSAQNINKLDPTRTPH